MAVRHRRNRSRYPRSFTALENVGMVAESRQLHAALCIASELGRYYRYNR
jgi:hypothetical protein